MALFTQKSIDFDYNSAELIFFYIDDYTIFKKQGFCFHPQYELIDYCYSEKDYSLVSLKQKNEFVDLFDEENVNIKVLCGRNGSGKSTLLEIMAGTKNTGVQVKKFYILRDKNGVFASSVKCSLVLDNGDENLLMDFEDYAYDFYPSDCCVNHKNMQIPDFDFRKNIVKFYTESPELYDGVVDGKLFTHFSIELWNFDNEVELMTTGSRKSLYKNENLFELKSWLKSDILSYYLLYNFQDNTYDAAARVFEKQMNENNVDLSSFLDDFVYTNYTPKVVDDIRRLQQDLFNKSFSISEISKVEKIIADLEQKILDFFQSFDKGFRENQFIGTRLNSLLYFKGFSRENSISRYLYDLSDGEWRSLKYRYEILHSMFQSNGVWWYIDEPEAFLHPEWCRTFIFDYMRAYKGVRDYLVSKSGYATNNTFNPNKRFTLVFATHSPFLLSDLTNDYIIYLEKNDRQVYEVKAEKECFAGNIGQMYNTNFFMKNTIGEFAKQKLLKIINTIDSKEVVSDEEIKKWNLLVSKIGDDLLKNLIRDKIELYEKNRNK